MCRVAVKEGVVVGAAKMRQDDKISLVLLSGCLFEDRGNIITVGIWLHMHVGFIRNFALNRRT